MPRLFCYECEHEAQVADSNESLHRCPACNSDFCEVLSVSRQETQHRTDEPPSSQQQSPSQDPTDSSMDQGSSEHGLGVEGDNAPNTTRHTTRFTMPNGHSYEVNFTTHVFQPGMEAPPGMPSMGSLPRPDGGTSQMFMVLGGGVPGPPSNEALASMFGNMGATPGHNGRFSPADFGMGQSLESLLAQLAELHQTREQPTAVAFRESLPRLKVPANGNPTSASPVAAAAAQGEPKAGGIASCHAGDTCCVCRNEFAAGSEVVQLPCDHCFDEACIMPWLEMHSTCPVCRRKLPHEDPPPRRAAPVAAPEVAAGDGAGDGAPRLSPRRTRSATRMASQVAQPSAGRPERRSGSNGPLQAGSNEGDPSDEDGNINVATMVMQQLATMVTGQLGQMGFTVPPDLTQQLHQVPQPGQQRHPQLRLHMRLPFSSATPPAAAAQTDAQDQETAGAGARQSEQRSIESLVMDLRRLQALSRRLQNPTIEAQFQQQLARLRRLGVTLQQRLALVETAYSAGSRQHDRLQAQVRAVREQVATLQGNDQRGVPGIAERGVPSALQSAVLRLLAFEDSLATAAGQLNLCRQSRHGLRENQSVINRHIASFDRAIAQLRPQGQPSDDSPPQHLSQQRSEAPILPCGGSLDSTEAAINGGSADHPLPSAIRPASSPAEGDGGDGHNRRRVRARTDQGQSSSGRAAAAPPHMGVVLGGALQAASTAQRDMRANKDSAAWPAAAEAEAMQMPARVESTAMSQEEVQSADGSGQRASATVRPFHSSAPTDSPDVAAPAPRVSQGFSVPLHAVPGAFGRLFGGLRGMFGRR